MCASQPISRILTYTGVLLTLLVASPASAQETPNYTISPDYAVRQWTNRNGLPNNTISALIQTSDGYLWMGTNEGLVRFDGLAFTVFNATNTPALASNRIARLREEPAGYLWVVTDQGDLALYHAGRFTRFETRTVDGTVWYTSSSWVYADADTVWLGTQRGLARYVDGRLEPYRTDLIDTQVNIVVRDRKGRLWVGTDADGLYRLDAAGKVEHFDVTQTLGLFFDRAERLWVRDIQKVHRIVGDRMETIHQGGDFGIDYEDARGNVWISSAIEGWWRHAPTGDAVLYPLRPPLERANHIREGPEGRQWRIGSALERGSVEQFIYRDEELVFRGRSLFGPAQFGRILFDDQGNLWIGTETHGLFRLRRSFLQTISQAEGLPSEAVYPILEDRRGRFWVGTFGGGLYRMDQDGHSTVFDPNGSGISVYVVSLFEDRSGTIWVGSLNRTCPMQGDRCRREALPEPFGSSINARAMLEDRRGRFWIGGEGGLIVGEGAARSWSRVESSEGLPRSWVRAITETRDGALLFGTNGDGLLRYVEDSASDEGPFEVLSTEEGLPSNLVRDLYEDREGYLWIALEDQGLCRLDRRGRAALAAGDLRCMDSRDGLYQSGLHRILEDDYGRFWFNTNNGIFWVERAMLMAFFEGEIASVTSVSYTEAEGMRNREGNGGVQPAGVKASDGRLWFPTQDGVVVIDPREVPLPEAPPVRLEAVVVDEERRQTEAGAVMLSAKERDVTIRYAALEFVRAEDVRFQYYLEGYDTRWRDGGAQRQATYTNLAPGSYVFRVRAGIGGVWSEAVEVSIERAPFFWETTWFLAVMGLFFLSVGPLIYAYRVRRLEANKAELEQVVAERTEELERANELKSRFLANISHEFRTPLTLTFGPLDDLAKRRFASIDEALPHVELARRNGHRLLRLINQLLELSRLDAGALLLHARRRDLARHLSEIAALFESIAHQRKIHFTVDIPREPLRHIFDGDKIEKVVVNLLSNAFKFIPPGGKVSISLRRKEDGAVCIEVADTGPGIAAEHLPHLFDRFYQVESASTRSHEGSGIGLALTKELIELHEGAIRVESTVGFGTRFTVELPPLAEPVLAAAKYEPFEVSDTSLPKLTESMQHTLALTPPSTAPKAKEEGSEGATVILVVEDNADMRAYIRMHLEGEYSILEAENGALGLEQAREAVPDLVLSDVMMPQMDGLTLCASLKEDERTSHIPVVLLTAKAEVEHRIAGFESGADAYLPKPFDAEELQVRVRALIAERERLRILFGARAAGAEVAPLVEATLPPREAAFVARVHDEIAAHLSEADFGVDALAEAVHMSRRQVHRKLMALTGETPAAALRRLRMKQAATLLRADASGKATALAVGFRSYAAFSRAFSAHYGVRPSSYGDASDGRAGRD